MLRYKTETRPGLVALYDIQPGNGADSYNPGARTWLKTCGHLLISTYKYGMVRYSILEFNVPLDTV